MYVFHNKVMEQVFIYGDFVTKKYFAAAMNLSFNFPARV